MEDQKTDLVKVLEIKLQQVEENQQDRLEELENFLEILENS